MSTTPRSAVTEGPTPSPQETVIQFLMGMWSAQAVATAARLGIPDVLADAPPQKSRALAQKLGADPEALARFLRALVSLGVLYQPEPDTYALTAVGEVLRSDSPGSMRDLLIAETDSPHWQAWGKLDGSVRSGQPMVPELFGMPVFDYYAEHPEELASFSRAMGNLSVLAAESTLQHYDFSPFRRIVDVGGANGDLLLAILEANPHLRGTVFDLPHVAEAAQNAVAFRGFEEPAKFAVEIFSRRYLPGEISIYSNSFCMTGPMRRPCIF